MTEPEPECSCERTLFDEAVELPAAEVAAYLERACPADAALRARVADLVASYHASEDMISDEPEMWRMPGAAAGQRIGPYRLVRVIGQGGFGEVWLARQEQPVRRQVALKILKPGLDTQAVLARFGAERQALAMMDHPNVARVFDAGCTAEGRPYFVMEYLEGAPLFDYAAEKKLSIRERLALMQQATAALQHAHQKGIIHRDVKPSNILVVEVDGRPVAKVIDFGVAKMITPDPDEHLTLAGQHWGTPAYMSPEQAAGKPVDTRTDVFSLGLVLFELLAGVSVKNARTPEPESTLPAPSRCLARMDAPALETAAGQRATSPKNLAATLRGELDWIVLRATAADPAARYESAAALRDDIERHLTGQAVAAGPPSAWYRTRKFIRRNRVKLATAGLVSVLMVAATIISLAYARRAEESRQGMSAALYDARLTEARAVRQSGRPGQRLLALEAIAAAAKIRPTAELRDEALAALALPDLKILANREILTGPLPLVDYDFVSGVLITGREGSRQIDRWRMSTGEHLGTTPLPKWMPGVFKFRIRPGGRELLVYSSAPPSALLQGLIDFPNILEVETGRVLGVVRGAYFDAQPGIYFDGGKRIALAMKGGGVALCDAATGAIQRRISHATTVRDIHADERNRRLLATTTGRPAGLLIAYDGAAPAVNVDGPVDSVCGCLAEDGRCGVFGSSDGTVDLFDPSAILAGEAQRFEARPIHTDFVFPVRSAAGGRAFLSSAWDTTLRLWTRAGGTPLTMEASLRAVSADGTQILTHQGNTFSLIEVVMPDAIPAAGEFIKSNRRHASFSQSGEWLALSATSTLKDCGGTLLCRLPGMVRVARIGSQQTGTALSPDAAFLFTGGLTGLQKWSLDGVKSAPASPSQHFKEPSATLPAPGDCQCLALSADGQWLAAACGQNGSAADKVIRVIDTATFTQAAALDWSELGGSIDCLVFDPRSTWLAAGGWKGSGFTVWSLDGWKKATWLQKESETLTLAVSPDGRTLASGSASELRLWDTATWQESPRRLSLPAVSAFAHCIAWSPRGDRLACEMEYGVIAILRPATLEREMTITLPDRIRLSSLTFSPDGESLAVSTAQNTLLYNFPQLAARLAELGLAADGLR